MHIQSCFWSSTGANLFRGIRWLCIILPSAPNSRNTLQVLLAVKHPVRNTLESEQLHSHPAVPGQIMWTRSCLALCPRFLPAPGCTSRWLVDGAVCTHVLAAGLMWFQPEGRGQFQGFLFVLHPRWPSQSEQSQGFIVIMFFFFLIVVYCSDSPSCLVIPPWCS